jgi:electron transfer flavoprotein alpha subunit
LLPGEPADLAAGLAAFCPGASCDLLRLSFDETEGEPLALPEKIRGFYQLSGPGLGDGWDLRQPAAQVLRFLREQVYELVVSGPGADAVCLLSLLAEAAEGSCLTEALTLEEGPEGPEVEKYLYNMNLKGRYRLGRTPAFVSASASAGLRGAACAVLRAPELRFCPAEGPCDLSHRPLRREREESSLAGAEKVLIAGRGVGGRESYRRAAALAGRLGWTMGASRPLVQEAVAPADQLVGASGAVLHAKKCLVLGASGMAAFTVGIENCGDILAVNTDADAAVFSASDLGLQMDCAALTEALLRQEEEKTDEDF